MHYQVVAVLVLVIRVIFAVVEAFLKQVVIGVLVPQQTLSSILLNCSETNHQKDFLSEDHQETFCLLSLRYLTTLASMLDKTRASLTKSYSIRFTWTNWVNSD